MLLLLLLSQLSSQTVVRKAQHVLWAQSSVGFIVHILLFFSDVCRARWKRLRWNILYIRYTNCGAVLYYTIHRRGGRPFVFPMEMNTRVIIATLLVFLGCCSNVIFLELLVKEQPGCSNLITFSQFLFIAIEGFVFATNFGRRKPVVPVKHYVGLVVMFFMVSVSNNCALSYDISMPLHMIFKSGSLIATMLLGTLLLKRRYPLSKYLAVITITIGIVMCTFASVGDHKQKGPTISSSGTFSNQVIGIFLLTFSLLISARMGIYQENLSMRFGKHPRESLFYAHALPLPGFLLLLPDIYRQAITFSQSAPLPILLLSAIPRAWVYLSLNIVTQYICIRSVYVLTTECSSLSVTLIITLRKFVSLVLSIFYFQNPFTVVHWLGTFLVFAGTLVFAQVFSPRSGITKVKETKAE